MPFNKKLAVTSLLLIMSLVLAACGDATNTSAPAAATTAAGSATTAAGSATTAAAGATTAAGGTATTAAAGGPKVELTMSIWAGVDEAKEFQAILDKVNASATTYHVTVQASPQDYMTKLQTGLASGTAADIFWVDVDNLSGLASKGSLLDLTAMVKNPPLTWTTISRGPSMPGPIRANSTACPGFRSRWSFMSTSTCSRPPG